MDGCVEQVLHHLVVVLPVVLVLVGCKVPEDMELLECCVQEEPVNLSRVILGVPQVHSKPLTLWTSWNSPGEYLSSWWMAAHRGEIY